MYSLPIDVLLRKVGSAYKLVMLTSMRAIELNEGAARLVEAPKDVKAINIAIQEILEDKIAYKIKEKK